MYSRIRHLLYCQDELAQLQKDLIQQDNDNASTPHGRIELVSRQRYEHRHRQLAQDSLVNRIGSKLKEYGKRCWPL